MRAFAEWLDNTPTADIRAALARYAAQIPETADNYARRADGTIAAGEGLFGADAVKTGAEILSEVTGIPVEKLHTSGEALSAYTASQRERLKNGVLAQSQYAEDELNGNTPE